MFFTSLRDASPFVDEPIDWEVCDNAEIEGSPHILEYSSHHAFSHVGKIAEHSGRFVKLTLKKKRVGDGSM